MFFLCIVCSGTKQLILSISASVVVYSVYKLQFDILVCISVSYIMNAIAFISLWLN